MAKKELVAVVKGDVGDLKQKMKQAEGSVKELGNKVKNAGQDIRRTTTSNENLLKSLGGLTAMLGIGGVAGAFAIAKNAMNSTQGSGDALAREMGAVKESVNSLMRAISTLDFKDFITNMKEAARTGREYANILDDLGDRINALKIRESELSVESIKLLKIGRDVTKSDQERVDAIKQMIAIEKDLMEQKMANAQIAFGAELRVAKSRSKLTEEEIKNYLRLYDTNADIIKQATRYNNALEQSQKSLRQINDEAALTANGNIVLQALLAKSGIEAREMAKSVVAAASDEVKAFARIEQGMNQLDDTMRVKLVNAWVAVNKESLEFETSTQRAETTMNGLIKSIEEGKRKIGDGILPRAEVIIAPLKSLEAQLLKTTGVIAEKLPQIFAPIQESFVDLSHFVEGTMMDMADFFGETLGKAINKGFSGKEFGQDFLLMVANWAQQLGAILVAAAISLDAFKKFAIANPIAAVGFGLALIAAGALIRGAVNSSPMGSGGGGGGSSSGGSSMSDLYGMRDLKQFEVTVSGQIYAQGTELVAVINNESNRLGY
jgi:uncharacterized protein YukE